MTLRPGVNIEPADPVTACGELANRCARISIVFVAIITGFACVQAPVTAVFKATLIVAPVAKRFIAIIAAFAAVQTPITA